MNISIKHYQHLSKEELHDIFALRIEIFIVEQNCPYQEIDGLDKDAYHALATDGGKLIGTLRILKSGTVYSESAIGRVATHQDHRGKKVAYNMMKQALLFIHSELHENSVRISAQSHLEAFYSQFGFEPTGKNYLEDGIPHKEMLLHQIETI
jgi:ElaA protein